MRTEPERAASPEDPPPTVFGELLGLYAKAFMRSRPTRKEARAFLAEADALAVQMEASTRLKHPASAAVRDAAIRREAVEAYWRLRPELELLV